MRLKILNKRYAWLIYKGWSELDRRLVEAVLIENYGVEGMSVFE